MSKGRLRVVSVGDARSLTRLARAVSEAAEDVLSAEDVRSVIRGTRRGQLATLIAERSIELLQSEGYVITRQVK